MIRIEGPHLGVEIPTDVLTRLTDAGPNTSRLRDLYFQIVLHVAAEGIDTLTVRPDEADGLGAPDHYGKYDADILTSLDLLTRTREGYAVADVDVYGVPSPKGRLTRPDAILGYATSRRLPFSTEDIADLLGITVRLAGNYLGRMHREGRLDRVGRGLYAIPGNPVDNPVDDDGESVVLNTQVQRSTHASPRARASKNLTTKTKTTTTTNNKTTTTNPKNLKTTSIGAKSPVSPQSTPPAPGRSTRIPLPFLVDDSMREWAKTETPLVNIDIETENFVDYWASKPKNNTKLDWRRTWQMWMRNVPRYSPSALHLPRPGDAPAWRNPECPPGMDIYSDEYAALKREAKAAWRKMRGAVS